MYFYILTKGKEYRINLRDRQCNVSALARPFHYRGVIPGSKFQYIVEMGASGVPNEHTLVEIFAGNGTTGIIHLILYYIHEIQTLICAYVICWDMCFFTYCWNTYVIKITLGQYIYFNRVFLLSEYHMSYVTYPDCIPVQNVHISNQTGYEHS